MSSITPGQAVRTGAPAKHSNTIPIVAGAAAGAGTAIVLCAIAGAGLYFYDRRQKRRDPVSHSDSSQVHRDGSGTGASTKQDLGGTSYPRVPSRVQSPFMMVCSFLLQVMTTDRSYLPGSRKGGI